MEIEKISRREAIERIAVLVGGGGAILAGCDVITGKIATKPVITSEPVSSFEPVPTTVPNGEQITFTPEPIAIPTAVPQSQQMQKINLLDINARFFGITSIVFLTVLVYSIFKRKRQVLISL